MILVITPQTSDDAFIVMPLIVEEPFSVMFSATKSTVEFFNATTLPNQPVNA